MEAVEEYSQQSPVSNRMLEIARMIVSHISLLFGLAVVLALSVAVILWATKPEYVPVADNISSAGMSDIVSAAHFLSTEDGAV
ncbi:MAG: hypothetical protein KDA77_20140, partial [Planctomycetaceae bacterium]|nr:hypothetical protein [Planctomycetaceae bacterium]